MGSGVCTFDDGGTSGGALTPKLGDHTLAEGLNTNSLAFGFMFDQIELTKTVSQSVTD